MAGLAARRVMTPPTPPCRFCRGASSSTINTYKHLWVSCDFCGNIVRYRKDETLAERLLPPAVTSWLRATDVRYVRTLRQLFTDRAIVANAEIGYAYFKDELGKGVENTKYRAEFDTIMVRLARFGVDVANREILDVSGGPGFFVHALSRTARRAVMTEFEPSTVRAASDVLGISTAHFDFNLHDIESIVGGAFDCVFIRYAINFCLDIPAFLTSLKRRLRPGAHVYVAFVLPTMGTCLRWQFDDLTYRILYHPETMARIFAEASFRLVARDEEDCHDYRSGVDPLKRVLFPIYELSNRLFSGASPRLVSDSLVHLYRYEPDGGGPS